jgi:hypothetical protein
LERARRNDGCQPKVYEMRQRCYIFRPMKGQQMRQELLAAVCFLALSAPAHAKKIDCNGYRYGMRTRDVVTLDINNKSAPACVIPNDIPNDGEAWFKKWCNADNFCTFRAHVKRRYRNAYIIDKIVGPVKWGD